MKSNAEFSHDFSPESATPVSAGAGISSARFLEGGFRTMRPVRDGRLWLHVLLFLLTLVTTTMVGVGLARAFAENRPLNFDADLNLYTQLFHHPHIFLAGLPFSLTLLTILLCHEMGHYLTCLHYGVDASRPYFIPAPTLIGTLGAFIRIRSPIYSKRILFDIGVAGPIAGFVALVAPLVAGVALSKIVPGIAGRGELAFGTPAILRAVEWLMFPGVPVTDIYLSPVARGAWVGLLATALNLLPIGQLDGGHILYAFAGERCRWLSRVFVAALVPLGLFHSYSWLVWAALLLLFGMRHPAIYDAAPVGRTRTVLGWVALAIFLLSFTASPIRTGAGG
ncbi:MAG: site-2 protease family protein [Bryobacteraceae bacterium]